MGLPRTEWRAAKVGVESSVEMTEIGPVVGPLLLTLSTLMKWPAR